MRGGPARRLRSRCPVGNCRPPRRALPCPAPSRQRLPRAGLAVAQKMVHTSGTALIRPVRLMGNPSRSAMTNMCPAPTAWALRAAIVCKAWSLPSTRIKHGPDASLKAIPNFMPGTVLTIASYRSSTVLMKWLCPKMRLPFSGISSRIALRSMVLLCPRPSIQPNRVSRPHH